MTAVGRVSTWKSAEAEARFRAIEDELSAELLAEKPEALDVPTRLGPTRVYRWSGSDPTATPVVFLHGASGTSLVWGSYAEAREGRTAYAVDTIGDVGRSRQEVPVESVMDLADWLDETMDAAGIEAAHFVGTSYGGFLSMLLAIHHPERVRSLYLLEPAGVVPVRMLRFLVWGMAAMFSSLLPTPLRRLAAKRLRMPLLEDRRLLRLALRGQLGHRPQLLRPQPIADADLRSISVPVAVVVGAKSEVFPPEAVIDRFGALVPSARIQSVPNAGHAVSVTDPEERIADLSRFLADVDPR